MRKKITVIGAGFVGATCAQRIAEKELGDVVLLDIIEGGPQGKSLDMFESAPIESFDANLKGTNSYEDITDSDIVVVTAGLARKPGMTREDLLLKNAEIIKGIGENIKQYAPQAIVILVTNPLDIMTQLMLKVTGFEANRVFGMAGILDSARFASFIAMELNVSVEDIQAMVLGGHGDSMVPLPRYTTISGIPLTQFLSPDRIEALIDRTRKGGAEIVALLKTGSAYYAPSSGAIQMVEAVVKDKKRILPCSVYLTGEYGLNNVYIGVPVKVGKQGVEKIIEIDLSDQEKESLTKSAAIVKENFETLPI